MCTAILSISAGQPVLLAGVRDELTDRSWELPGPHWPAFPGIIGGKDLQAGGTWLAVEPHHQRAACVLNGVGTAASARSARSRGVLPLRAAAGLDLDPAELAHFDPFLLLTVTPGGATLQGWDGGQLTGQELPPGLHLVVNGGLTSHPSSPDDGAGRADLTGRPHELGRVRHFLDRFTAMARPTAEPGLPVGQAWGDWLPLLDGDGLDPQDNRALIVRRTLEDGRTWGTTSISLVALAVGQLRYDFTASPGDSAAWYPVL